MIPLCPVLTSEHLDDLLGRIGGAKLALIGDLCLDAYWTADMRLSELSRETPHHPLPVISERYSPGGAGNVACNVAALQPKALTVLGLLGNDWRGDQLEKSLKAAGVNTDALIRDDDVVTNTYIKPLRTGISSVIYEDPRLDFENRKPISEELSERLCRALDEIEFDVLLVSDQMRFGIGTEKVRAKICELGAKGKRILVDSRDRAGTYRNVMLKPNEVEAARLLGREQFDANDPDALLTFAKDAVAEVAQRTGTDAVITLGGLGCVTCAGGEVKHCPGVKVEGPIDTVGAGDTFLSAMGSALAAGESLELAARFASLASSVTIKQLNTTGVATPEALRAALK